MSETDGKIDFSTYKQGDLETSVTNIDKVKFPKNFANLDTEITRRKSEGKWDSTESAFKNLVDDQRGIWTIICIAYLPIYFGIRIIYGFFNDHEIPFVIQLCFGVLYLSMAFLVRRKLGQMRCPNCKMEVGIFGVGSTTAFGKCPHCGYELK